MTPRAGWFRRATGHFPAAAATPRQRGFALLIVLWTLVLISFLIAHLTASGSTEIRIAGNIASNAAAREAADGAIYQSVFSLLGTGSDAQSPFGARQEVDIGGSRVTVVLENEADRINPNLASPLLVAALLRVLGTDPQISANIAAAIADWVGLPLGPGAETTLANQVAAGEVSDYPPHSPFESMSELSRVRGMTPALAAAMRPHLTLFGPAIPDSASADPLVVKALALLQQGGPDSAATQAQGDDGRTIRIHAVAQGPGNADITRTAVVHIDASGYSVMAWNDGVEPWQ